MDNPYCLAKMYLERCRTFSELWRGSWIGEVMSELARLNDGSRRFNISRLDEGMQSLAQRRPLTSKRQANQKPIGMW